MPNKKSPPAKKHWIWSKVDPRGLSIKRKTAIHAARLLQSFNTKRTRAIIPNTQSILPFAYLRCKSLARFHYWEKLADDCCAWSAILLPNLAMLYLVWSFQLAYFGQAGVLKSLWICVLAGAAGIAGLLPIVLAYTLLRWLFEKQVPDILENIVFIFAPVGILVLYVKFIFPTLLMPAFPNLTIGIHIAALTGLIGACTIALAAFLALSLTTIFDIIKRKSEPEAMMFLWYVNLLNASKAPRKPAAFPFKTISTTLDMISRGYSQDIPNKYLTGDIGVDQQILSEFQQISHAVRRLKLTICLNHSDSRRILEEHVKSSIEHVAVNDWNKLARAEAIPATRAENIAYAGHVLKMLLIAGLPILVVMGLRRSPLEYTGKLSEMAFTAIVLWTSLSLYCALDPGLIGKDGMIREVFSLFASLRNKKD